MPESDPVADTPGDAAASPDTPGSPADARIRDLERELKLATRTGRYAVITALCAAVVSSGVSAGSAIYVSGAESRHKDRAETAQALRNDRQQAYTDFVTTVQSYGASVGALKTLVDTGSAKTQVGQQIIDVSSKASGIFQRVNSVWMVGSRDMIPLTEKTTATITAFAEKRLNPLALRYFAPNAPGAADEPGYRRDAASVPAAVDSLTATLDEILDSFLKQARTDFS